LEGFHDENTQVQLQLLTAIVKLFLKRPTETQELVQQVLSLATQDSDNPDLRDRGFIYWRLLSTDPAAAKEVVLAEKPLISEETDLLEPTLLDELICHIGSLASVYHKPPSAFVEGKSAVRKTLPARSGSGEEGGVSSIPQPAVIPAQDSLIGDLLSLDLSGPSYIPPATSAAPDILGGGLDSLLSGPSEPVAPAAPVTSSVPANALLGDIFGIPSAGGFLTPPKQVWLPAMRGKGLEVSGTFTRKGGNIVMEMTLQNKAMSPMNGFAIQLNKNSFGLTASSPLSVPSLNPNQSLDVSLVLSPSGQIQKMEPLTNLQVAMKNNVDVFYFSCIVPIHVYCVEDGAMDKRIFLTTWKEIPPQNEVQFVIENVNLSVDQLTDKLQKNNVFTLARRNVDGQEMLYQSVKLTNNVWVLTEMKTQPGNPTITLSLKCRSMDVAPSINQMYEMLLLN